MAKMRTFYTALYISSISLLLILGSTIFLIADCDGRNLKRLSHVGPFGIPGLNHGGQFGVVPHHRMLRETQGQKQQAFVKGIQERVEDGRVVREVTNAEEGQRNIEQRGTRITRDGMMMQGKMQQQTQRLNKREIANTIPVNEQQRWTRCNRLNQSIFDFSLDSLDGQPIELSKFKGNMLLIVNVATFCAYTDHYHDFGPLLDKYPNLRILLFPCNQFGLQEPAENHEILNGIRYVRPGNNYQLPQNAQIFAKIDVNGEKHNPLYEFLKDGCPQTVMDIGKREQMFWNPIKVNDVTWNFEKFLIDGDGLPRFRFHPTAWQKGKLMDQFIGEIESSEKVKLEESGITRGNNDGSQMHKNSAGFVGEKEEEDKQAAKE